MSRRRRAEKRDVLPDPKFGDLVLTKFMNYVMYEGKKAVAENIIYGAFDLIEAKRRDQGPLETFHAALENVQPSEEVRRGGSAAPPIRCRWKFVPIVAGPWPSAGWSAPRASGARTP